MPSAALNKRFFGTTRGQLVALLRRGVRTVEELARAVGLTDNAVRAHLSTLERDGLVRQEGIRRSDGPGKPASLYEIHPDAEPLFSRAYAPVLVALLAELGSQMPTEDVEAVMRATGRRLAGPPQSEHRGDLASRVRAGAALLNSLGGEAQVEEKDGAFSIRGCGCPLSVATARGPAACQAVESLLTEVIGTPVRETCDRGERPRCCFQVGAAA